MESNNDAWRVLALPPVEFGKGVFLDLVYIQSLEGVGNKYFLY